MGNKQEKGGKEEKGKGSKAALKPEKGKDATGPSPRPSGNERDYIFKILTIGDQGTSHHTRWAFETLADVSTAFHPLLPSPFDLLAMAPVKPTRSLSWPPRTVACCCASSPATWPASAGLGRPTRR